MVLPYKLLPVFCFQCSVLFVHMENWSMLHVPSRADLLSGDLIQHPFLHGSMELVAQD